MTRPEPYNYVTLRYVHDITSYEFLNVGLAMFLPERPQLLSRCNRDLSRIKGTFADLGIDSYTLAVGSVERGLKRVARGVEAAGSGDVFPSYELDRRDERNAAMAVESAARRAKLGIAPLSHPVPRGRSGESYARPPGHDLTALDLGCITLPHEDCCVQWSPAKAGVTSDPWETFENLYRRLVIQCDDPTPSNLSYEEAWRSPLQDHRLWSSIEERLREIGSPIRFEPQQVEGRNDAIEFRHAVRNGAWHAFEPLSLDFSEEGKIMDTAHRWLGQLKGVRDRARDDLRIHFIAAKPRLAWLEDTYRLALDVVRRAPFEIEILEEDDIDVVVDWIGRVAGQGTAESN